MRIGMIGAGFIGRNVATAAIGKGHEVMVSNSRTPDTLHTISTTLGVAVGSPAEAAAFGDIVLVAIPLKAYESVPVAPLRGKVVLDASNYYPDRDGQIEELDRGELTTSDLLARHLPESKVVKAFNAIQAGDIVTDGRETGSQERRALPIAGDDAEAKATVIAFLDELGFDVVDAGPLAEGRRFEPDTPAYCVPLDEAALRAALSGV